MYRHWIVNCYTLLQVTTVGMYQHWIVNCYTLLQVTTVGMYRYWIVNCYTLLPVMTVGCACAGSLLTVSITLCCRLRLWDVCDMCH